jgi:hypothetical protein
MDLGIGGKTALVGLSNTLRIPLLGWSKSLAREVAGELRLAQLTKSALLQLRFRYVHSWKNRPGSILNLESKFALRQRLAGQRSWAQ